MRPGPSPNFPLVSRRDLCLGATALATAALTRFPAVAQSTKFKVFNGLLYSEMPDLRHYGVSPVHVIDRGIWPEQTSHFEDPDPRLVAKKLHALPDDGVPLVMDFEFYSFSQGLKNSLEALEGLTTIAKSFKTAAPSRPIGFYGYMPVHDYFDAIKPKSSSEYRTWQDENTMAGMLNPYVDFLAPSLYTFYNRPADWQTYARAQISEARRISDKPVYAFIWPHFHNQGKKKQPSAIPADFWRLQLETMSEIADGVILWGGWNFGRQASMKWNSQASWWVQTKEFLASLSAGV